MPVDSSIALGIRPGNFISPQELANQKAQFDQNQLAAKLGGMKVQEFEQGQRDQNMLRDVYSKFGNDTTANVNSLYKAGLGKEAGAYAKSQTDQAKSVADSEKAKLEAQLKKFEVAGQIMSGVSDQATWDRARAQTAQAFGPEAAAQMPEQYDANLVEQKRTQALGIKDQLEQKWKAMSYTTPDANARLSADTSRANNAASVGATIRGQNMVDSRSRETTAATLSKPFEITGEDGKPVLVQQDKQGNIKPVTGYTPKQGASKPLTDTQAKALQFGSRMQNANDILSELSEKGVTTSIPGSTAGFGVGSAINAMQPQDRQRLDQAKRDFINAVLRRESGAAISPSEFDSAEKQYFPQPFEGKEAVAQKKKARELSMRGILAEVPDSDNRVAKVRAEPAAAPAALPSGWKVQVR